VKLYFDQKMINLCRFR